MVAFCFKVLKKMCLTPREIDQKKDLKERYNVSISQSHKLFRLQCHVPAYKTHGGKKTVASYYIRAEGYSSEKDALQEGPLFAFAVTNGYISMSDWVHINDRLDEASEAYSKFQSIFVVPFLASTLNEVQRAIKKRIIGDEVELMNNAQRKQYKKAKRAIELDGKTVFTHVDYFRIYSKEPAAVRERFMRNLSRTQSKQVKHVGLPAKEQQRNLAKRLVELHQKTSEFDEVITYLKQNMRNSSQHKLIVRSEEWKPRDLSESKDFSGNDLNRVQLQTRLTCKLLLERKKIVEEEIDLINLTGKALEGVSSDTEHKRIFNLHYDALVFVKRDSVTGYHYNHNHYYYYYYCYITIIEVIPAVDKIIN